MKRTTLLLILFSLPCFATLVDDAESTVPGSKEFLERVRRPPTQESWAKLSGKAVHRRAEKENREQQMSLGIRFTPERMLAQVYVDQNEFYNLGQQYGPDAGGTSVIQTNRNPEGKSVLADFGLRPEDLTLSFLYWDFDSELDSIYIKGRSCRVFVLKSKSLGEKVKIYIDTETFFPIKAEWGRSGNDGDNAWETYRTIEISSFKKESDFWFPDGFVIYGPGWKTKIEFDSVSAGFAKDGVPEDIFKGK